MQDFLEKLWNHGMTEEELTTMVAVNPARLLGL
jgi:predicted metal-dependent phosphotriesterase family hydrolase